MSASDTFRLPCARCGDESRRSMAAPVCPDCMRVGGTPFALTDAMVEAHCRHAFGALWDGLPDDWKRKWLDRSRAALIAALRAGENSP